MCVIGIIYAMLLRSTWSKNSFFFLANRHLRNVPDAHDECDRAHEFQSVSFNFHVNDRSSVIWTLKNAMLCYEEITKSINISIFVHYTHSFRAAYTKLWCDMYNAFPNGVQMMMFVRKSQITIKGASLMFWWMCVRRVDTHLHTRTHMYASSFACSFIQSQIVWFLRVLGKYI